jgi:hypothetical protein
MHNIHLRKARLCSIIAIGAVLAGSGCAPPKYFGQAAPSANYYPLAVGDRWIYEFAPGGKRYEADVTERKTIGGVDTYAMAIDRDYSYMAVLPSGIYQFAQGEPDDPTNAVVFSPAQRMYKLPFVVGDSWNTPVLLEPDKSSSEEVELYGRVETVEDVVVPAGRFKNCVCVLIDDPRDSPADQTELWFAPNVGIVQTRTTIQRSGTLPAKIYYTKLVGYQLR